MLTHMAPRGSPAEELQKSAATFWALMEQIDDGEGGAAGQGGGGGLGAVAGVGALSAAPPPPPSPGKRGGAAGRGADAAATVSSATPGPAQSNRVMTYRVSSPCFCSLRRVYGGVGGSGFRGAPGVCACVCVGGGGFRVQGCLPELDLALSSRSLIRDQYAALGRNS